MSFFAKVNLRNDGEKQEEIVQRELEKYVAQNYGNGGVIGNERGNILTDIALLGSVVMICFCRISFNSIRKIWWLFLTWRGFLN